jgi:hypothetical protein
MLKSRKRVVVAFGDVIVETFAPTRSQVRKNIRSGQEALARALPMLLRPGVHLDLKRGTPIFYGDRDDPSIIIREMMAFAKRGCYRRQVCP